MFKTDASQGRPVVPFSHAQVRRMGTGAGARIRFRRMGSPMTVQFTPKSRDLARSAYGVVVRSPGKRAVFIVLLVLLALLGGVSGGGTVWSLILAIAFVGVGLASVALASFVRPRSRRPRTIMFSEDGVEVRTPKTDVKRPWLSFKDLYIYSRGLDLPLHPRILSRTGSICCGSTA